VRDATSGATISKLIQCIVVGPQVGRILAQARVRKRRLRGQIRSPAIAHKAEAFAVALATSWQHRSRMAKDRSVVTRKLFAEPRRRYPGPMLAGLAGAVVFWAVFVAPRGSVAPILGWVGAGICAITSVTFFVLVVSPPTLDLDDAGFGIGNPLHRWRFRWTDVGPFVTGPSNVGAAPRTVVYFDIDAAVRSRPGGRVRRLNRRLTGHDFAIPHTYGQDVYELAALLNASRDHALTAY
jgi:hypothetical protein